MEEDEARMPRPDLIGRAELALPFSGSTASLPSLTSTTSTFFARFSGVPAPAPPASATACTAAAVGASTASATPSVTEASDSLPKNLSHTLYSAAFDFGSSLSIPGLDDSHGAEEMEAAAARASAMEGLLTPASAALEPGPSVRRCAGCGEEGCRPGMCVSFSVGDHMASVRGAAQRMGVEVEELRARGDVLAEEVNEVAATVEVFRRGRVCVDELEGRKPIVVGWEGIGRWYLAVEEENGWNSLASKFLQIGIPRRHRSLPGAVVRSSATVDARRTLRQMREGSVVVVEEVAGNWARISSPVKGWVWRTHLKPLADVDVDQEQPLLAASTTTAASSSSAAETTCSSERRTSRSPVDSPLVTLPSLTSFPELTPGGSSSDAMMYACSADNVSEPTVRYDQDDADSLCGLRLTVARGSVGTVDRFSYSQRGVNSDTDYRSCASTQTCESHAHQRHHFCVPCSKALAVGDRVRFRDAPDQYWSLGVVGKIFCGGRVLVIKDGCSGFSSWKYVFRFREGGLAKKDNSRAVVVERRNRTETLGLDLNHSTLAVKSVDEGSPGEAAGVRAGMRLVSVEGMPVNSMRDIRTMLRTAGERVALSVVEVDEAEAEAIDEAVEEAVVSALSSSPPEDLGPDSVSDAVSVLSSVAPDVSAAAPLPPAAAAAAAAAHHRSEAQAAVAAAVSIAAAAAFHSRPVPFLGPLGTMRFYSRDPSSPVVITHRTAEAKPDLRCSSGSGASAASAGGGGGSGDVSFFYRRDGYAVVPRTGTRPPVRLQLLLILARSATVDARVPDFNAYRAISEYIA